MSQLISGTVKLWTIAHALSLCKGHKGRNFIDSLQLFSLLANVADVKSLVIHPASTTHSQLSESELREQGIQPNTVRLSIGTENIKDILADLEQAFAAIAL